MVYGRGRAHGADGRLGDMYLQGDGTVWQFTWPAGWVVTTTDLTGPQGDVDAATLEYDALDQPLDVVPARTECPTTP